MIPEQLNYAHLTRLAKSKMTPVSLKQLYTYGSHVLQKRSPISPAPATMGKLSSEENLSSGASHHDPNRSARLLPSSEFLYSELPIRVAQSLLTLNAPTGPASFSDVPAVRAVSQRFVQDISVLLNLPKPTSAPSEEIFARALRNLQRRHRQNRLSISQAFKKFSSEGGLTLKETAVDQRIQCYFDRFHNIQLGTGLLVGGHLALRDHGVNIVRKIAPLEIARTTVEDARRVCSVHYGMEAPEVQLISATRPDATTVHVESHVHRVLFEILKNSLRAVMDRSISSQTNTRNNTTRPPPLKLIMAAGGEDFTFKLQDEGGGVPFSEIDHMFGYTYSTFTDLPPSRTGSLASASIHGEKDYVNLPLSGYGLGLPLARLIARYFGGDLSLVSMDGFGTDTYVHFPRADTFLERLPSEKFSIANLYSLNASDSDSTYDCLLRDAAVATVKPVAENSKLQRNGNDYETVIAMMESAWGTLEI